jgi:hypothetical protein
MNSRQQAVHRIGTIAKLAKQGHQVHLIDMTNGEPTPRGTPEIRAGEAASAAGILGVTRTLLGLKNREVTHNIDSRHKLAALIRIPSVADFTAFGASPVLTDTRGGIHMTHALVGGYSVMGGFVAVPAAPYTLTAKLAYNGAVTQQAFCTFGIHLSDGTKYSCLHFGPHGTTGGTCDVFILDFNTTTALSTNSDRIAPWWYQDTWLQVVDDNANRTWKISRDGVNFQQINQVARTQFLTPTQIGFSFNSFNCAPSVTLQSWRFQ